MTRMTKVANPDSFFAGRVYIVTGGSRGLGLVLARALCAQGARVAVCARDSLEVQRAQEDLEGRGGDVYATIADVGDPAEAAAFVREVATHFGDIHGVINNAGVIQVGPYETMDDVDFETSLRTHFWAPFYMVREALPYLKRHPNVARVANISSIGGKVSAPHLLPYCVGKHALVGFTQGLRSELAQHGIVVTSVVPGLMRTGSPRQVLVKGDKAREYAWFAVADSLPLLSMDAERAARAILRSVKRGEAETILTVPAWVAVKFNGIFPELTGWFLKRMAKMLPVAPDPSDHSQTRGADIDSPVKGTRWTRLSDEAALRNNEIVH